MSIDATLNRSQLRGLPYETAKLYGMPHLGCDYRGGGISSTYLTGEFPKCAACGITTGCHGKRHNGLLRIRWEWDDEVIERKWWNGFLLSHGYAPHCPQLFDFGRYVLEADGKTWEVRR